MSDETTDMINAVVDTADERTHSIVTGSLDGQPGFAAWDPDEPGVRTIGETRWEAVYHLAIHKEGAA